MDDVISENPVDTSRIYVTGQSMGGAGTYGAVFVRPKMFAAAINVSGGWADKDAAKLMNTPT